MPNRSIVSRLIWLLVSALAGIWLVGSVTAALLTRMDQPLGRFAGNWL